MNVRNIYRKLRQGKTLTGDECAVLEAYERQAAPEPGQAPRTVMDLPVARAMWARDGRDSERS